MMAPALVDRALEGRQFDCGNGFAYDSFNNRCYRNSSWDRWGRWVALAVIIGFFLLVAFSCSCVNSRRRRRRGLAPRYGTGWLAGKYNQGGAQNYNYGNTYPQGGYGGGGGYAAPAPPYSPPNQQYGGANNDYYSGQQSGIELQQPQSSYQPQYGREQSYDAPAGPPPGKRGSGNGDGIIR